MEGPIFGILRFSERRIASIHGYFLPSLAFILFACKNVAFYNEIGFLLGFTFSTVPLYRMVDCSFGFHSEPIDCEQKSLDFEELEIAFASKNLK